jgi:hypothetical protein
MNSLTISCESGLSSRKHALLNKFLTVSADRVRARQWFWRYYRFRSNAN